MFVCSNYLIATRRSKSAASDEVKEDVEVADESMVTEVVAEPEPGEDKKDEEEDEEEERPRVRTRRNTEIEGKLEPAGGRLRSLTQHRRG